jgi:hypothetical protein
MLWAASPKRSGKTRSGFVLGNKMFRDIILSYTDSASEFVYVPEVLEKAFVDVGDITYQLDRPERYIVTGPKGAGKTAIASHLLLRSQSEPRFFSALEDLEHFQYQSIDGLVITPDDVDSTGLDRWISILHLRLLSLVSQGPEFGSSSPAVVRIAQEIDTRPDAVRSLQGLVEESSKRSFFEKLASFIIDERALRESEDWNFRLAPALRRLPNVTHTGESSFVLLLDGMDYALRDGHSNRTYLVDLLNAAIAVNSSWHQAGHRAKVVLLLRDEVVAGLPDPNLNKKKSDHGVELKWYDNTREPLRTRLVSVIGKRARLAGYTESTEALVASWLPGSLLSQVLNHTRYLPRDLIRVFFYLQQLNREPPFSDAQVHAALGNYSPWFLDELLDCLKGLIAEPVREGVPRLFAITGSEFAYPDFERAVTQQGLAIDPRRLADLLFLTSWIGNVQADKRLSAGKGRVWTWYHRNPRTNLESSRACVLHRGLWKALNLLE